MLDNFCFISFHYSNNKNSKTMMNNNNYQQIDGYVRQRQNKKIKVQDLYHQKLNKKFKQQSPSDTKNNIRKNSIAKRQQYKAYTYKPVIFTGYSDNLFVIQPLGDRNSGHKASYETQHRLSSAQQKSGTNLGAMSVNIKANTRRVSSQLQKQRKDQQAKNCFTDHNHTSQKKNHLVKKSAKKTQRQQRLKFVDSIHNLFNANKSDSANFKFKNAEQKANERYTISSSYKTRNLNELNSYVQNLFRTQLKEEPIRFEKKNFDVIGLRPQSVSQTKQLRKKNFQQSISFFKIVQGRLRNKTDQKFYLSNSTCIRFSAKINKQKKPEYGWILGKYKSHITSDEQYKLKILYYKDLIWKIQLNLCIKFKPNYETSKGPKFYIGHGNNSRLVKSLLSKRWWWTAENRQQSANFVWTQLKISSIYSAQKKIVKVKPRKSTIYHQVLMKKIKSTQEKGQTIHLLENESYFKQHSLQIFPNNNQLQQTCSIQFLPNEKEQKLPESFTANLNESDWFDTNHQHQDPSASVMNKTKYEVWNAYINKSINIKKQLQSGQQFLQRKILEKKQELIEKEQFPKKVSNHLEYSRMIGNKKALYKCMKLYQKLTNTTRISSYIPLTYLLTEGLQDKAYPLFLKEYYKRSKQQNQKMWIVKPGEMSNRGNGIKVCQDLQQIKEIIKKRQTHLNGSIKSYIIQQYIFKPFLYKGRKFDLRHYIMISCIEGKICGYFYKQGYIRTTSYQYNTNLTSSNIHLTNDAIQKNCKDYGKYQKGNKLSYEQFDKYLQNQYKGKYNFFEQIYPQIRVISKDIINAAYYLIDPCRRSNNFEIFGLDIMIDDDFKPWLIQVNTNPCLQLSSPLLAKMIPRMLDNAFTLTLDVQFPPPSDMLCYSKKIRFPDNYLIENKFQLVFDQDSNGQYLDEIYNNQKTEIEQMQGYGSDEQAYQSNDDQYDAQY